jgi:predicted Ser/Thr protein kinase
LWHRCQLGGLLLAFCCVAAHAALPAGLRPAVFHTWPPRAEVWLLPAHGEARYVGRADEPIPLDLAATSTESTLHLQFRLDGCVTQDAIINRTYFMDHDAWPGSGRAVLEPTSTATALRWWLRLHPLAASTGFITSLLGVWWLKGRFRAAPSADAWRSEHRTLLGSRLGAYRLLELIGRGGFAVVFRAVRDDAGADEVAVKVLNREWCAQESFRKRFAREIEACARLSHANLVRILDWGEEDAHLYMVMEYVRGESLRSRVGQGKPWPVQDCVDVISALLDAVAFAHAQGIIHRDLKPENVMLSAAGIKVLDFGIARLLDAETRLTNTSQVLGTIAYMAPERLERNDDNPASDQFAIGVMAYEMLTGRLPFAARDAAMLAIGMMFQPARPFEPDDAVPTPLAAVVMRMLEPDPAARFGACQAARVALLAAVDR